MADNTVNLRTRFSADLSDIKQGLALLRGDLAKVKAEAAKAAPDGASWANGLRAARQQIVAFVAAYASLRTVGALSRISDEASTISARLKVATRSQEEFNRAQAETFAIAQRTRTNWEETVSLYSRVEQSSDSLGLSQQQSLKLTEAVAKALALSGASGEEAAGVMRQFGQALGNGRVQAEEFNSIADSGQRIVQALAKHLGIATSQVKSYVNAGKVSSKDLAQAVLQDAGSIDESFAKFPTTISGALTQIRNAFVQYIGRQNEATGAAQAFSGLLQQVASDLPAFFEPVLQVMVGLAKSFRDAKGEADGFSAAADGAGQKAWFMAEAGEGLASVLRVLAAGALVVKNVVEALTVLFAGWNTVVRTVAESIGHYLGGSLAVVASTWQALKDGGPLAALEAYRKGAASLLKDFAKVPDQVAGKVGAATDSIGQQIAEIRAGIKGLFEESDAAAQGAGADGGSGRGGASGAAGAAGKAVAASNAALRDAVTRALAELDRLYGENEISIRQYFQTRLELQQKSIDLEIAQARAEQATATTAEKRRELEDKVVKLQRDRAEAGATAARAEKKANEELTRQLGDIQVQLLELDGNAGAAARARLEEQYRELFKRLEAESDTTGKATVRNLIDRLASKAQLDQLKDLGSRISGSLQATETSVSAQVSGGLLGYGEGDRRLSEARAKALDDLRQLREAAAAYLATLSAESPEGRAAQDYLASLDADIANVAASQRQFGNAVADQGVASLADAFFNVATAAAGAKDAVIDMVRSFVSGVARMVAQALALRAVQAILRGFGFGGGSEAASGAVSAAVHHQGGLVGRGAPRRRVSPLLFGSAPRYHTGSGTIGLAPGEEPAILKKGERVLNERQNAAWSAMAAGAGGGAVTTPIVAIGDAAVADALASAAGERVVLTHVRNNWEGLTRGGGNV